MILYAVQNKRNADEFMGYDNRGAMATGYPLWFNVKSYPDRIRFFEQYIYAVGHLDDAVELNLDTSEFHSRDGQIVKLVIDVQPGTGVMERF